MRRLQNAQVFGDRVRRYRTRLGIQQQTLADLAGHSLRWLWAIENGQAQPTIAAAELLAEGLRVDLEELLGLVEEDDVKRRQFLFSSGVLVAGMAPGNLLQGIQAEPVSTEHMEKMTGLLGSMIFRQPAAMLRPLIETYKKVLMDLVAAGGSGGRELKLVASQVCSLLSSVSYSLGDHGSAMSESMLAEQLAREAGDGSATALAMEHRRVALSAADVRGPGNPLAVELLEAARRAAGRAAPPEVQIRVMVSLAEELAALGRATEALKALDVAGVALARMGRLQPGENDHWDSVRLDGWRAGALLHLNRPGDAAQAAEILERVAPATPSDLVGYRTAMQANLGAAYALAGEPDRCVELQLEALNLADAGHRRSGIARVRRIRERYLAPYADLPAVQHLDQMLASA